LEGKPHRAPLDLTKKGWSGKPGRLGTIGLSTLTRGRDIRQKSRDGDQSLSDEKSLAADGRTTRALLKKIEAEL